MRRPPKSTLFPYTTLFRSHARVAPRHAWLIQPHTTRGIAADHVLTLGERQHAIVRSEEHTSELQSQSNLVCRLLLEKNTAPMGLPSGPIAETIWPAGLPSR